MPVEGTDRQAITAARGCTEPLKGPLQSDGSTELSPRRDNSVRTPLKMMRVQKEGGGALIVVVVSATVQHPLSLRSGRSERRPHSGSERSPDTTQLERRVWYL